MQFFKISLFLQIWQISLKIYEIIDIIIKVTNWQKEFNKF